MIKWMDRLALWQFASLYASSMLLVVVVGALVVGKVLERHVDPGSVVAYGAVFTATQTVAGAWVRQWRLQRCSWQERVSVPDRMRPYVGLPSEPEEGMK
jgi:hypothetical protein